jgi:hypothetical protein
MQWHKAYKQGILRARSGYLKWHMQNMYLASYTGKSEVYLNSQLMQKDKVYVFDNGTSLRNPSIKPIYFSDIVGSFCPHSIEFQDSIQRRKHRIPFQGW